MGSGVSSTWNVEPAATLDGAVTVAPETSPETNVQLRVQKSTSSFAGLNCRVWTSPAVLISSVC